jgi:copper chaperone
MCGCSDHAKPGAAHADAAAGADAVTMKVEDMTCGHCASTITGAIKGAFPGVSVHADPASKLVSVTGAPDAARLHQVVRDAGYTPAIA